MLRYLKGYKFELRIKRKLEEHGWTVLRLAGSKPIDLLAFKQGKIPLAIECRIRGPVSLRKSEEARARWARLGLRYLVVRKKVKRRRR